LRQYGGDHNAKEQQKAQTLLAEIPVAQSDADALRTLLVIDDPSFDSFSKGDFSTVVFSHPALVATRIATLKKNLAEASRRREEERKGVEAERIAEERRIDAEKKAAKQRAAKQEAEQRRELAVGQAKQEGEKTASYDVLKK